MVSRLSASGSNSDEPPRHKVHKEFISLVLFVPSWLAMKILIANIGSTSLKWRLFDFANNAEKLLHKGGFERVSDYAKAIEDCLAQLKEAKAITTENELTAVGFKT